MGQNNTNTYIHDQPRSFPAFLLAGILRLTGIKKKIQSDLKKAFHNKAEMPDSFYEQFDIQQHTIDEQVIWIINPKNKTTDKTVLYLHGGAYIYGVHKQYWNMIKALVEETQATFIIPDYPLAPENTAHDVRAFMNKVYDWLSSRQDIAKMTFLGDSAGGGLILGYTQHLRNEGKILPQQLILLSPWLDVNMDNPVMLDIEKKDPMLSINGLRLTGKAYSGSMDTNDFFVSPIYGNFENLPTISIFISTHDILFADTEKLVDKLDEEHIPFNYYVYPKLFHDWIVVPNLKESRNALEQIDKLIN